MTFNALLAFFSSSFFFDAGSKVHMIASTVSSKLLRSMAEVEGFQFEVSSNFVQCVFDRKRPVTTLLVMN